MKTHNFLLAYLPGSESESLSHIPAEKAGGQQVHRAFYSQVRTPSPEKRSALPKVAKLGPQASQPESGGHQLQPPTLGSLGASALNSEGLEVRRSVEGSCFIEKVCSV